MQIKVCLHGKRGFNVKNNESGGFWGFGGAFVSFCEKLFDILMLGLMCLVCCLPIVTAGASITALYYSVVKSVKKNNGYPSKEFARSFVRNLKPGFILELIFAVLFYILQLNVGIIDAKTESLAGLFFIVLYTLLTVFLILMMCYAFPALSRFDMSVGWIIKLSIYMVVRYLGTSICLLLILFCFGVFVWKIPLLIFVVPGPMIFVISEFMERVLKKHEPKAEAEAEEEVREEETGAEVLEGMEELEDSEEIKAAEAGDTPEEF